MLVASKCFTGSLKHLLNFTVTQKLLDVVTNCLAQRVWETHRCSQPLAVISVLKDYFLMSSSYFVETVNIESELLNIKLRKIWFPDKNYRYLKIKAVFSRTCCRFSFDRLVFDFSHLTGTVGVFSSIPVWTFLSLREEQSVFLICRWPLLKHD